MNAASSPIYKLTENKSKPIKVQLNMQSFICKVSNAGNGSNVLTCTASQNVQTADSGYVPLVHPGMGPEEIAEAAGLLAKYAKESALQRNPVANANSRQMRSLVKAAPAWTDSDFVIPCHSKPPRNLSMTFTQFLASVNSAATNSQKDSIITAYTNEVLLKNGRWPLVDADGVTANLIYRSGTLLQPDAIFIGAEWNGWGGAYFTPANGIMTRISLGGEYADFFYFIKIFEKDASLDYKIIEVSSSGFNWIFDPLNPLASPGGFGGNSLLVMPCFCPAKHFEYDANIPHGQVIGYSGPMIPKTGSPIGGNPIIDPNNINRVLDIYSSQPFVIPGALRNLYVGGVDRDQYYWVYLPAGYNPSSPKRYPTIYFGDGNDYLSFSNMNNVLDGLIACGDIPPVIGVFHSQDYCQTFDGSPCSWPTAPPGFTMWDARGYDTHRINSHDPANPSVHFNAFQDYLKNYLIPTIDADFPTIAQPEYRVVAGDSSLASMAFNAALKLPNLFGNALVQSLLYEEINLVVHPNDVSNQANLDSMGGPTLYVGDYIGGAGDTPSNYVPGTATDVLNYIGSNFPVAKTVKYYLGWGSYEYVQFRSPSTPQSLILDNSRIVDYIRRKGASIKSSVQHTGHNWRQWAINAESGLSFLLGNDSDSSSSSSKSWSH
jgi:hypothetical protein